MGGVAKDKAVNRVNGIRNIPQNWRDGKVDSTTREQQAKDMKGKQLGGDEEGGLSNMHEDAMAGAKQTADKDKASKQGRRGQVVMGVGKAVATGDVVGGVKDVAGGVFGRVKDQIAGQINDTKDIVDKEQEHANALNNLSSMDDGFSNMEHEVDGGTTVHNVDNGVETKDTTPTNTADTSKPAIEPTGGNRAQSATKEGQQRLSSLSDTPKGIDNDIKPPAENSPATNIFKNINLKK